MTSVVALKSDHYGQSTITVLANKQDLNGAIDELDLVENLDVEQAVNTMKCPTRVEICSCVWNADQSKDNSIGIKYGYKWLLDTIIKNYTVLNTKLKISQNPQIERNTEAQNALLETPSKLSIHSNPFKPIRELISKKEDAQVPHAQQNGIITSGQKLKKMFTNRNKTAPITTEESIIEIKDTLENVKFTTKTLKPQKSLQTLPTILDPVALDTYTNAVKLKSNRPCTAPEHSHHFINTIQVTSIPGQVTRE